jgi:hypothetical protein
MSQIDKIKEDFEKHTTVFVDRRVEGLFSDVLYKNLLQEIHERDNLGGKK